MRMTRLVVAILLLALPVLAGCSQSPLRDEYMGKSFLQPHKLPRPVEHDEYGNAIPEPSVEPIWPDGPPDARPAQ